MEKAPEEVDSLGIPKSCKADQAKDTTKQTCQLTKKQLEKIKFKPKPGSSSITIEGMDDDTVELNVEHIWDDKTNRPNKKMYYLKSTSDKEIKIKGIKEEGDIVLKKGVEVYFGRKHDEEKLRWIPEEVNDMGIPNRCYYSWICKLTKKQLEKIKFKPKPGSSSITIEGMDDDDTVELNVEYIWNDEVYFGLRKNIYYLKSTNDKEIKIKGKDDVVLKRGVEVYFREREERSKLELDPGEVDNLGIPKKCNSLVGCKLTKEQLEKIKFETKSGVGSISVEGMDEDDTVELNVKYIWDDETKRLHEKIYYFVSKDKEIKIKGKDDVVLKKGVDVYFKEKKDRSELELYPVEVNNLGIPEKCNSLIACKLTKEQLEKIKFETKPGSSSIAIEGMNEDDTVGLYIQTIPPIGPQHNSSKNMYYFVSNYKEIKIKGKDDVVLKKGIGVYFKEKEGGSELEWLPEEVNSLGILKRCSYFGICELKKEQLEKIKFETKPGSSSITIEGMDEDDTIRLQIMNGGMLSVFDDHDKDKKMYYFVSEDKEIKIKGKDDVVLKRGVFYVVYSEKQDEEKLEWIPEMVYLLGIPKRCSKSYFGGEGSCELTKKQLEKIKFETKPYSSSITIEGMDDDDTVELNVKYIWDDETKLPHKKMYYFVSKDKEIKIKGKDDVVLKKGIGVYFKEKEYMGGGLEWLPEEVNSLGILKRCSYFGICELKKEQLEKIKFETKSGSSSISIEGMGDDDTVELNVEYIRDDRINYPKNKKYTLKAKSGTVTIKKVKSDDIVLEKGKDVYFREKQDEEKLELVPGAST